MTQSVTSAHEGQSPLTLGHIPLQGGGFGNAYRVVGGWDEARENFTPSVPLQVYDHDGNIRVVPVKKYDRSGKLISDGEKN